jgi:hypothetical protein
VNTKLIRREVQAARNQESDSLLGIFFLIAAIIGGVVAFALHELFQLATTIVEVAFG